MKIQPSEFWIGYLLLLPILTVHESAHAWVAHKCGDDTAKEEGRLSVNPVRHIDLIGTVIVPFISLFFGGWMVGWGKPVPVNPANFERRRLADNVVALAGPASNILFAALALIVARLGAALGWSAGEKYASQLAYLSIFLAFFNLIPIPPLDGSRLLKNAIRLNEATYARFYTFGLLLLIVLVSFFPQLTHALASATEGVYGLLLWLVYLAAPPAG